MRDSSGNLAAGGLKTDWARSHSVLTVATFSASNRFELSAINGEAHDDDLLIF